MEASVSNSIWTSVYSVLIRQGLITCLSFVLLVAFRNVITISLPPQRNILNHRKHHTSVADRVHSPWSLIEYSYFLKNHILSSYKCSQESNFKAELIKMLLAGRSVRFGWVNILILLWFLNTPQVYYSFWRCQKFFFSCGLLNS